MKILICTGSQRQNGNTDRILSLIRAHLQAEAERYQVPLELEMLRLGQLAITPCRGCRVCFDRGEDKCPLKDDLPSLKLKMQAADGVLVASPVYVDDMSGLTKNWIDRLAYVCHRPEFGGKCAYLVATVGSTPTSHTLGALHSALSTWGFCMVGQAGFKMGALMPAEAARRLFDARAATVARRFFQAIHTRQFERPSFMSLLVFKVQQRAWQQTPPGELDYQYWRDKGWLDPRCTFYHPHRANPLKVALARLTGRLVARFVS